MTAPIKTEVGFSCGCCDISLPVGVKVLPEGWIARVQPPTLDDEIYCPKCAGLVFFKEQKNAVWLFHSEKKEECWVSRYLQCGSPFDQLRGFGGTKLNSIGDLLGRTNAISSTPHYCRGGVCSSCDGDDAFDCS